MRQVPTSHVQFVDTWAKLKYGDKQPLHSDYYYYLDDLVKKVEHF